MNKKIVSLLVLVTALFSMCGCGSSQGTSKENNIEKDVAANYEENIENIDSEVKEDEANGIKIFHISNPSWEYYNADDDKWEVEPLELEREVEKANEIIDDDKWFAENKVTNPNEEFLTSKEFTIDKDNRLLLTINDRNIQLDFSDYKYADYYKEEDKEFIDQEINFAALQNNILYVSIGHRTYAKSCPHNAYIVAVNLDDMKVLWKTEPLTCNSRNFEVTDNVIICGYGFTEEDDYLKQIDIKTGRLIDKIPLKSAAHYIILKGNDLYVRCYDTDYKFNVKSDLN